MNTNFQKLAGTIMILGGTAVFSIDIAAGMALVFGIINMLD